MSSFLSFFNLTALLQMAPIYSSRTVYLLPVMFPAILICWYLYTRLMVIILQWVPLYLSWILIIPLTFHCLFTIFDGISAITSSIWRDLEWYFGIMFNRFRYDAGIYLAPFLKHSAHWQAYSRGAIKEMCTICQEEFNRDENLSVLRCGHLFHQECVEQYENHYYYPSPADPNAIPQFGYNDMMARPCKCPICRASYDVYLGKFEYDDAIGSHYLHRKFYGGYMATKSLLRPIRNTVSTRHTTYRRARLKHHHHNH